MSARQLLQPLELLPRRGDRLVADDGDVALQRICREVAVAAERRADADDLRLEVVEQLARVAIEARIAEPMREVLRAIILRPGRRDRDRAIDLRRGVAEARRAGSDVRTRQ